MTPDIPNRPEFIEWRTDVSLLGQPTMLWNFAKVIVLSVLLMGSLLSFLVAMNGDFDMIPGMLGLTGAVGGGFAVLMLLVILVVFRNRMAMAYRVDAACARMVQIDRRAKVGTKAAIILGALSGSPSAVGAGLLAETQATQNVAWSAVRKVRCSPRWRTVQLANSWRTVLILYCTPETYEPVARYVEAAVGAAPHVDKPNPVPGLLVRSLLTILASITLFILPRAVHVDMLWPLLVMAFALTSVWFLPIFGWVVMAGLAWIATLATIQGADHGFDRMDGDEWAGALVGLAGAAYLAVQSFMLLRGRVESALAGDLAEMEEEPEEQEEQEEPPPPVDERPRFCTQCGARLDAQGRCPDCRSP
jgi:hypothetical protein